MAASSRENAWVPDRPLTPEAAAALIGRSFPHVDATAPRYLGSGSRFDAFLTSDGWAFRFPRLDWCGGLFEPEARVHRFVAEILPSQLRIPRVELLAAPTPAFPRPFAGHRYIPGVGVDAIDDEALVPTLQQEIAVFLTALHSAPVPLAGGAGIHELVMDEDRRAWLAHGTSIALRLRGLDAVVDEALAWLAASPAPPPFGGPLQVVHGSLEPEHLLADPATGFLNGVIDWTDTHLGDPARDFVFLVTWRGWEFTDEVLRLYSRALDRDFRTRLRYSVQLLSLMSLAFAHEQGADPAKYVGAVRKAFASHDT